MLGNDAHNQVFEGHRRRCLTEYWRVNTAGLKLIKLCQDRNTCWISKLDASKLEVLPAVEEATGRGSGFSDEILAMDGPIKFKGLELEKSVQILAMKGLIKNLKKEMDFVKKELCTENSKVQLCQLMAIIKNLKKEMNIVKDVKLNHSPEPLWKRLKEGSLLSDLLESLKINLDVFIEEIDHLRENRSKTLNILRGNCDSVSMVHVDDVKDEDMWEPIVEAKFKVEEELTKDNDVRSKTSEIVHVEAQKKLRKSFDEVEAGLSRTMDEVATLCKGADMSRELDPVAELVLTGEEEGSKELSMGVSAASISLTEVDPVDSSFPEFSIRDYVSGVRQNELNMNWPFSQSSFSYCMNNSTGNLLPPFQTFDSIRNGSSCQFLAEKTSQDAGSNMDEKPLSMDNHPTFCTFNCRSGLMPEAHWSNSNSSPSSDQNTTLKGSTCCHLERESGSPSKFSVDEEQNRVSLTPPIRKWKGPDTPSLKKKRKLGLKSSLSDGSRSAEDIASSSTVAEKVVASKTCPVCENFSSPSYTKLNAHIDQCLSAGSPTDWIEYTSKSVKPRMKSRKIKLVTDIYSSAICCTLEELNRRNGKISENADADSGNTGLKVDKFRDKKRSLAHVEENGGHTAVYIGSNGKKIRILSCSVDELSGSRAAKELKPKIKGKSRKVMRFSKRHLTKGQIRRKKLASARAYAFKGAAGDSFATQVNCEDGVAEVLESQKHSKVTDSVIAKAPAICETLHSKGNSGRPKCKVQATKELLTDNRHSCSLVYSTGNHDKDPSPSSGKDDVSSVQSSTTRKMSLGEVVVGQNNHLFNERDTASRFLLSGSVHSSGKSYLVSSKLDIAVGDLSEPSDITELCSSSTRKDYVENITEPLGKSSHASQMLSKTCVDPEASRFPFSEKRPPFSNQSLFPAIPYVDSSAGSILEKSSVINLAAGAVAWCDGNGQAFDLMHTGTSNDCSTSGKMVHSISNKLEKKTTVGGLFDSSDPDFCNMQSISLTPATGVGRMNNENEDAEGENGSLLALIETIPIPGPPGSYLPSFRDNYVEDLLGKNPSLRTSCMRSYQESSEVPFLDPLISAAAISVSGNSDRVASISDTSCGRHQLDPKSSCLRSVGESAETRMESVIAEKVASHLDSSIVGVTDQDKEMLTCRGNDYQQRCHKSMEKGASLNASLDMVKFGCLSRTTVGEMVQATSSKQVGPSSNELGSSVATESGIISLNLCSMVASECVPSCSANSICQTGKSRETVLTSSSPPSVLRLMGKDLMLVDR